MTKQSGLADSPFFSLKTESVPTSPVDEALAEATTPPPEHVPPPPKVIQALPKGNGTTHNRKKSTSKQSRNRGVMTSRNHGVMTPLLHDTIPPGTEDVISKLRSIVRQIGKEPTTCRLTVDEKKLLKSVEFDYSTKDIQTSANEIMRIAMNFIVDDYRENGEQSILDKVLRALNE
jgi:hypothetical protein